MDPMTSFKMADEVSNDQVDSRESVPYKETRTLPGAPAAVSISNHLAHLTETCATGDVCCIFDDIVTLWHFKQLLKNSAKFTHRSLNVVADIL